jgi:sirohydrochlorin ferrochelatase
MLVSPPPRLLVVAHGTRSEAGSDTTTAFVDAVRAARPELRVDLCFLDVGDPTLAAALADAPAVPTVVVPLLLSTGYHVQQDIPAAVAGHPGVVVARHLGPDELLVDALVERLAAARRGPVVITLLVGAGSRRPEAAEELRAAGKLLAARLGRPVEVTTLGDDLVGRIRDLSRPAEVAAYLLTEGRFAEDIRAAARAAGGDVPVSAPIGAHPALVELVLRRYAQALGGQ